MTSLSLCACVLAVCHFIRLSIRCANARMGRIDYVMLLIYSYMYREKKNVMYGKAVLFIETKE